MHAQQGRDIGQSAAEDTLRGLLSRYRRLDAVHELLDRLRAESALGHNLFVLRWVFLRVLALIYIYAFWSFWVQADGLLGSEGILPVDHTMSLARDYVAERGGGPWFGFSRLPTLCWFGSEGVLLVSCLAGICCGLTALTGILMPVCFFGMWLCYLSCCSAGLWFMSLPCDTLLLEAGFLAVFFAPWQTWPRLSTACPPSFPVVFLYRWLVFRLMVGSGLSRLADPDGMWWPDLAALGMFMQSQPLPAWLAAAVHQAPPLLLQGAAGFILAAELLVPVLVFTTHRLRMVAAAVFIVLQGGWFLCGLTGFQYLLGAALCLLLLDDEVIPARIRAWWLSDDDRRLRSVQVHVSRWLGWGVFAVFMTVSTGALLWQLGRARTGADSPVTVTLPAWFEDLAVAAAPFRTIGTYGLLTGSMADRPELVIEGSADGRDWYPYVLAQKPGPLNRPLPPPGLHLSRLDWRMWYAAHGEPSDPKTAAWLKPLLYRLLSGSQAVLGLLEYNPFPEGPPRFVRVLRYQYLFSGPNRAQQQGRVWSRSFRDVYVRPVSLEQFSSPFSATDEALFESQLDRGQPAGTGGPAR